MRITRRALLGSSIASVAAPAVMRVAYGDAPVTLKLHHSFSAVSSVHDKFLLPWARKVEAESSGRIQIDIFPSMQLGGAPAALFDQARDGVSDIAWAAPSLTPGRFPRIETFELPFLASSRSLVSSKALMDFAAVNLKDEFHEIYPLCFSCSDRAVVHATGPIRTVEDVKDLKIHVQTRLVGEAMRTLGAHPVLMPNAQLPDALTQHVVDACIDPWHVVPPLRLNELLRSHTEFSGASPGARTYVLAMNKGAYDRLPRDLKIVIDNNSGQLAAAMAGAMWDIQAAAVANTAVERGDLIVTLLPEAVARWRKATEPVIEAWRKEMKEQKLDSAKLLLGAHALLAKYANEPEPQPQPQPSQTPPSGQQAVTQQPRAAPDATPKFNNGPPNNGSAAPQAGAPAGPVAKPAPPSAQPSAPHVATPAPAAPSPTIAKPASSVAPAPQAAAPARPAAPPPAAPPAPSLSAPTVPPAPPTTASVAPAAKPMAAPMVAPTPAPAPTPVPAPAPPSVAAAPPAPPAPPVPKPVPKTFDIPL